LLMGLRLTKGINQQAFISKTGYSFFDYLNNKKLTFLLENDFLGFENDNLFATNKGRLVLNNIINQLVERG
ncbi:MAG: coproporphyrinogen III oxidase, partial [Pseudomonadota bacterium]